MREDEILALLRSHDEQGMEELLRHYGPLMRYIITPILQSRQDTEDCLSEVSMRIWEKLDTFDADRGSFTAWLTAIARNTALNLARQRNHQISEDIEEEPASHEPTPEETVLAREREAELKHALELLSAKERNLFYRKYYYMQPTEKIAAELCMTVRAVEGKLYRIKKKLRRLLGGDEREA